MARLGHHQRHRTINASIYPEKAVVHRNDIRTSRIVGFHHNLIFLSILQLFTNLTDKGRIPTLMRAHQIAVDIYFRTSAHSFKTQEQAFPFHRFRHHISLPVISCSLIKRIRLHLHVLRIPGMRNGYFSPLALPLGRSLHHVRSERAFFKPPAFIKADNLSRKNTCRTQTRQQACSYNSM